MNEECETLSSIVDDFESAIVKGTTVEVLVIVNSPSKSSTSIVDSLLAPSTWNFPRRHLKNKHIQNSQRNQLKHKPK